MIFIDSPPLTSLPVARHYISWRDNGEQLLHSFLLIFLKITLHQAPPTCAMKFLQTISPGLPALLTWEDKPETQVVEAIAGHEPVAIRRPGKPGAAVPAAVANHAERAG